MKNYTKTATIGEVIISAVKNYAIMFFTSLFTAILAYFWKDTATVLHLLHLKLWYLKPITGTVAEYGCELLITRLNLKHKCDKFNSLKKEELCEVLRYLTQYL